MSTHAGSLKIDLKCNIINEWPTINIKSSDTSVIYSETFKNVLTEL